VQIFKAEMDRCYVKDSDSAADSLLRHNLREALYWKALNFASVARLGGCAQYPLDSAFCEADDACRTLQNMCGSKNSQAHGIELFVEATVMFCRAQALKGGHVTVEQVQGKTQQELWQECLNMYLQSYRILSASRLHLNSETVKAVTMIAMCNIFLGHTEAAIEWAVLL
jgi:hypothetical protein